MALAASTRLISAEEFQALDFDAPVELIRGEIVEMTRPGIRHGVLCITLGTALKNWSAGQGAYLVIGNDAGLLTLRNPDSVRGPDVMVVKRDRLPDGKVPEGWLTVAPELTVEVMSPSDRWDDLLEKTAEYLTIGVREVWIVSPEERSVHCFAVDVPPRKVDGDQSLVSESVLPGFALPLSQLFTE